MFWILGVIICIYALVYSVSLTFFDCDLQLKFYEYFGQPISRLRNKVVFITGASSGIGEHLAYALAAHGAKLVLAARRLKELERVKENCLQPHSEYQTKSEDILLLEMDVCKWSSNEAMFNRALDRFGHLDVFVNNAGRSQRARFEETDINVDMEIFQLNVFATLHLTRLALSHFKQSANGGHIVTISSVAGRMGLPNSSSYNGSKHALHGYMNSLRAENVGRNISIGLICPGPVFTNFLQNCYTNKLGATYGMRVQATDNRMTAERCGHLCAINIANTLEESWMANYPFLWLVFLSVYFPNFFQLLSKTFGDQTIQRLRDNRAFYSNRT